VKVDPPQGIEVGLGDNLRSLTAQSYYSIIKHLLHTEKVQKNNIPVVTLLLPNFLN